METCLFTNVNLSAFIAHTAQKKAKKAKVTEGVTGWNSQPCERRREKE